MEFPLMSDTSNEPAPEVLKLAYKAFKKRLKLTSLDNQSKVGKNPLTGGNWGVEAIVPPDQYPREVWDALVKQGKLKYYKDGLYSLGQP